MLAMSFRSINGTESIRVDLRTVDLSKPEALNEF